MFADNICDSEIYKLYASISYITESNLHEYLSKSYSKKYKDIIYPAIIKNCKDILHNCSRSNLIMKCYIYALNADIKIYKHININHVTKSMLVKVLMHDKYGKYVDLFAYNLLDENDWVRIIAFNRNIYFRLNQFVFSDEFHIQVIRRFGLFSELNDRHKTEYICENAMLNNAHNIMYVPRKYLDLDLYIFACKHVKETIKYVPSEYFVDVVKQDVSILQAISYRVDIELLKDLCFELKDVELVIENLDKKYHKEVIEKLLADDKIYFRNNMYKAFQYYTSD